MALFPSFAQKHLFYSEMAKLLEAGFGIREAADVMAGDHLPKAQRFLLEGLHRGLEEGKTITGSLGENRQTVSGLECCLIEAGERGGRLPGAMQHLADYFGMLSSTRRETLKSLVHPILVLHLGVFIGTVPMAMMAGDKSSGEIIGSFFITLLITYALVFIAFLGIRSFIRKAKNSPRADALLRRIPLVGKARGSLAMAAFTKVYHTCLLAGIPMRETVRMASEASQSGMILDAGKRLEASVAEGNPIGPQLLAESAFPKSFARSYSTGEAAGTLDKDLAHWSTLFQREAEAGFRTLSEVFPRFLYFLILIFVAWKVAGFYQNYYGGMLEQLQ